MANRFFFITGPARALIAGLLIAFISGCALAATTPDAQKGKASYYSDRFQGALTASGTPFDQQALTAAHPTLPLGTKVLVTRPDTGKTVKVVVNDRGPYVRGRIIDLSKRAARKLNIIQRGVAQVTVRVID
ncbi:septal ring lytic transglycosylase RlpA family protein [Halomonas garicola]|uniref:septal ring lytic transglycosylase RlpA family protein n=1 Tax=Halomonas garicola TaxID=1690008 RepID=UPI00289C104B|nr:septal ring lytic transglycosylase RlpA family protein [Halomonas garicola]